MTRGSVALAVACLLAGCRESHEFSRENAVQQVRAVYPQASLPSDEVPPGVRVNESIAYGPEGDRDRELDLYLPPGEARHPILIIVHGGGWESGNRNMERPLAKRLAGLGYAAAPVSYRLRSGGRFPNALYDLKDAIRWLRKNANRYSLDAAHIGAIGASAGGQLVALLGATNGMPAFEGDGGSVDVSSDVEAIVDIDGVADFTGPALVEKESRDPAAPTRFLGGSYRERTDTWRDASAISHVGPHSAPTLFLCSTAKTPILPGRPEMCARLKQNGIACELVVIPDTPHPFWLMNPWFEPTIQHIDHFMRQHL